MLKVNKLFKKYPYRITIINDLNQLILSSQPDGTLHMYMLDKDSNWFGWDSSDGKHVRFNDK